MSEKIYTVLAPPPTTYEEDPRAKLTDAEEDMYEEVLKHFIVDDYTLSGAEGGEGSLKEHEKFWLSRECLLRFLRASKWKVPTAIQRLETTLKWRREFGIYDRVSAAHVEPEATTGKEIIFGYDTHGRPGFYMIPSRQNTDEPKRQIEFAFWMLERCIDLMEPGIENIALLINFADRAKNPSMSTARAVLNILQEHYPERLGLALIINVPFLVNAFFKIIMPFVDPVTREKVKFNPQVVQDGIFEKDQLMSEWWNGDCDFVYDHEKYWPDLVEKCEKRVSAWMERWRELGGEIGVSEWEYKQLSSAAGEKTTEVKEISEVVPVITAPVVGPVVSEKTAVTSTVTEVPQTSEPIAA